MSEHPAPKKKWVSKQELETQLRETQRALQEAQIDLDIEKEQYNRLSTDWNALISMLERVLGVKVYSDGHVWIAEYDGKKSGEYQAIAEAFEAALISRPCAR
jgi:hypothetical protein